MDFKLTRGTIEQIFKTSEGAISPITGRRGHFGEKHLKMTNTQLIERTATAKNNEVALFTAFDSLKQAIDVAVLILNHSSNTKKLENLYYSVEGNHSDGQLSIKHDIGENIFVRYNNGTGRLPTSLFQMVLHKKKGFPCNFMIYTFYPTLVIPKMTKKTK